MRASLVHRVHYLCWTCHANSSLKREERERASLAASGEDLCNVYITRINQMLEACLLISTTLATRQTYVLAHASALQLRHQGALSCKEVMCLAPLEFQAACLRLNILVGAYAIRVPPSLIHPASLVCSLFAICDSYYMFKLRRIKRDINDLNHCKPSVASQNR